MIRHTRRQRVFGSLLIAGLIALLLVGILTVSAQGTGTPISVGGVNETGDLSSATSGIMTYSLAVRGPQSVAVLLLGITPGFGPAFTVKDASGTVILDSANAAGASSVSQQVDLPAAGTYSIEIRSATSVAGQYLLSLQPGVVPAVPAALTAGTPIGGTVNDQTPQQIYTFSGSPSDVQMLSIAGTGAASGPLVTLRDADTQETLGVSSTRFSGVDYRIPASAGNYQVEVAHSEGAAAETFSVCLSSGATICAGASALTTPNNLSPVSTPELDALATEIPPVDATAVSDLVSACQVASANGQSVNIRSNPGTGAGIVGRLSAGVAAAVTGRTSDTSWLQINVDGLSGWVSAAVVTATGDCSGVAVLNVPIFLPQPTRVPPTAVPQQPTNPPPPPPTNPPPTKKPTTEPTNPPPTVDPNQPTHGPVFVLTPIKGKGNTGNITGS